LWPLSPLLHWPLPAESPPPPADLILLGLLSHEPHLCLLREAGSLQDALQQEQEAGDADAAAWWSPVGGGGGRGGPALLPQTCPAHSAWLVGPLTPPPPSFLPSQVGRQPLELLRVSTLRDGLRCELAEFCTPQPHQQPSGRPGASGGGGEPELDLVTGEASRVHPSAARRRAAQQGVGGGGAAGGAPPWDFERLLDDVVACTFLAGNDFLPALPSLDIYDRPSALDTLLEQYKVGGRAHACVCLGGPCTACAGARPCWSRRRHMCGEGCRRRQHRGMQRNPPIFRPPLPCCRRCCEGGALAAT
jgi:hypothetical protein